MVLVHVDMAKWLDPFILTAQGDWKSAEAVLVRREGDSIQFLSPLRYSTEAPLKKLGRGHPGPGRPRGVVEFVRLRRSA